MRKRIQISVLGFFMIWGFVCFQAGCGKQNPNASKVPAVETGPDDLLVAVADEDYSLPVWIESTLKSSCVSQGSFTLKSDGQLVIGSSVAGRVTEQELARVNALANTYANWGRREGRCEDAEFRVQECAGQVVLSTTSRRDLLIYRDNPFEHQTCYLGARMVARKLQSLMLDLEHKYR